MGLAPIAASPSLSTTIFESKCVRSFLAKYIFSLCLPDYINKALKNLKHNFKIKERTFLGGGGKGGWIWLRCFLQGVNMED